MRERLISANNIARHGSTLEMEAERLKTVEDMTDYTKMVLIYELAMHYLGVDNLSFSPAREFISILQDKIKLYGLWSMINPPTDAELLVLFRDSGRTSSQKWEEQGHVHTHDGMDILERIYMVHDQITPK